MMLDHEIDSDFRCALFTRLGKKDYVPIELNAISLQEHHDHQPGRHIVFVIQRATSVNKAVFSHAAKRIGVPFVGLRTHHIRMRHY